MIIRPEDMPALRYAISKGIEGLQAAIQLSKDLEQSAKMQDQLRAHIKTLARLRGDAEREE